MNAKAQKAAQVQFGQQVGELVGDAMAKSQDDPSRASALLLCGAYNLVRMTLAPNAGMTTYEALEKALGQLRDGELSLQEGLTRQ